MVSIEEASQIIQSVSAKLDVLTLPITEATGRVLAEEVFADRDIPPFNRVAMDGIAIDSLQFKIDHHYFIEDIQAAGVPRKKLQNSTHCMEVMTGAVLPEGTDAVVRYEELEIQNGSAQIKLTEVSAGLNIHKQGVDAKKNETLLNRGQLLSPAEIALLASVGKTHVSVFEFPKAVIVSSGDELVEISAVPLPHQIRRSNVYALQAAMFEMGWHSDSYHLADEKDHVKQQLGAFLKKYDVLILSGGVSKGKFDFIPEALNGLGVKKLFHGVSQRPGKPFWFGRSEADKVVFALPGNPVSTFLCFFNYIKPWIYSTMGILQTRLQGVLGSDIEFQPELSYFVQVHTKNENGVITAYPFPGGGSGDFVNLNEVDGFLELPLHKSVFKKGEVYNYIPFR